MVHRRSMAYLDVGNELGLASLGAIALGNEHNVIRNHRGNGIDITSNAGGHVVLDDFDLRGSHDEREVGVQRRGRKDNKEEDNEWAETVA
jgi:hypothetical protein